MKWSLYLGKVFGIKVYAHWTFWILIIWIFLMHYRIGHNLDEALMGVVFVLALFLCVALHELGHALVARRFNVVTRNITFLPIGGVANMERIPEKPVQELLMAIAGPLVNAVIAIGLFTYLELTGRMPTLEGIMTMEMGEDTLMSGNRFLFNLMMVNIVLFVFNLIPAFPMDGGRILRAVLGFFTERVRATRIAARIGQALAIVFVFAGFYGNFWLVFIGIFVFIGAMSEEAFESSKHFLLGYTVKDVLMKHFTLLPPEATFDNAAQVLLNGQEREFLVGEGDRVDGVLTRNDIIRGLQKSGKEGSVVTAMQKDFPSFKQDMELHKVYDQLLRHSCPVGPVFSDGRLIGVLDLENVRELISLTNAAKES